jgi:CubicO group peptidase (beta-lactamase class C family)
MTLKFSSVWAMCDAQVASGRIPGYVGAIRIGGEVEVHAGGRMALGDESPPMRDDTRFRIASVTKPIGGALTLSLVQDGLLALDDPIARWMPEAANPRVVAGPDAPLDRTIDADRPITVRDLLACTSGWGISMDDARVRDAMLEHGVHPGPVPGPLGADEFVARVCALPLACQPGEGWRYDTGVDLAGVVLMRATGRSLSELLDERIARPLGMDATAFWTDDPRQLATAYAPGPDGLTVLDPPDGAFARPPAFEHLSGGLVSSAPDLLRFFGAMADGGAPVLTNASLATMTSDALGAAARRDAMKFLGAGRSWGLATAVDIDAVEPWMAPGRWGWDGGTGTTAFVDPARDTVAVLLTQRAMAGPLDGPEDFWAAVARAA